MIKNVIVKKMHVPASSLVNFDFDSSINYEEIKKTLENDWIRFDPRREIITCKGKKINNVTNITESILNDGLIICLKYMPAELPVSSQYDDQFNDISNQCTWVSQQFLYKKKEILNCIHECDWHTLKKLHNECLKTGTHNRKTFGTRVQGENIDEIEFDANINMQLKSTIYGSSDILSTLGKNIVDMIIKPDIKIESYSYFIDEIKNMKDENMMMLNRDGQTFSFLKINDKFVIFDSHITSIKSLCYDDLIRYILEYNDDGFFYIIWFISF